MTVREWMKSRNLIPEGYNPINDDQDIECEYKTPRGDEMIVFGLGEGIIINPIAGGGSIFVNGPIDEFLNQPNEKDWSTER